MTVRPLKILLLSLPTILVASLIIAMAFYVRHAIKPTSMALKPLEKPLPLIELEPLHHNGSRLTSRTIATTGGVINVFASWCAPCLAEHPYLMTLHDHYKVPIYGINWKDDPTTARIMLEHKGNPYRLVGQDTKGNTGIILGITGVPESFIVSKDGMITHKIIGPITEGLLETELAALLVRP